MLAKIQPVVVLKSPLPFPYDSLCLETLKILEDKVKQTNIFDMKEQANNVNDEFDDRNNLGDIDIGLVAHILYLGLLPSLADNPEFATIFSCICNALGQLAHFLQESHLCTLYTKE